VSKDIAGKNYHTELALELEKFLDSVVERFGGVVGLVDLYCMYNRARGTDLISPEDLNVACSRLNNNSNKFMLKIYRSGVKTIQSSKCCLSYYFS
jgi:ESCRT-II complex subunit VPS36